MDEYIKKRDAAHIAIDSALHDAAWCAAKIRALPPADVRPVVRGKWEHLNWGFDYDRCSVCGYEHRWTGPFYFCPRCGADMREA